MKKIIIRAVLLCLPFFLVYTSHAVEIADHEIAETIQAAVPGSAPVSLKLNGAGIRTRIFFKVYIAALYLAETKNTTKDVLDVSGPKQMNLTMLKNLKSKSLAEAFNEGVRKNTDKAEIEKEKLEEQFAQLDKLFLTIPELNKGDVLSIAWVPKEGTTLLFNGKKMGETFPNVAFFNALLRIWLGDDPVSASLKKQLLG